jgi:hypothetical protein
MLQFAPAARLVPQLLAKSYEAALTPVTAMLVMVSAAVPLLVTVIDWDELDAPTFTEPKARLVADKLTGGSTPVPLSAMDCGEVLALSVIVMAAVSAPPAVGAKWPWMVQLAPAARLVPQLFANTNEEALAPVTAMLVMERAVVALLVMVRDCEPLDEPTVVEANDRLVADKVTGAAKPAPVSAMLCGELPALSVMVMPAVSVPATVGAK